MIISAFKAAAHSINLLSSGSSKIIFKDAVLQIKTRLDPPAEIPAIL